MTDSALTVSQAAATVGLSTYALRWYEQEGKIGLYDRTEG